METRINGKFDVVNERLDGMDRRLDGMDQRLDAMDLRIDTEVRGLKILIETNVTQRLDALLDGYKMNMEKQYELEQRVERLEELHQVV